jgi:hypothetical protein
MNEKLQELSELLVENPADISNCISQTAMKTGESEEDVLNLLYFHYKQKYKCFPCEAEIPGEYLMFPCKYRATIVKNSKEYKELCDEIPHRIPRKQRLQQARREFEIEKKEMESKKKRTPKVKFAM